MTTSDRGFSLRQMLNKVPEVTFYFWVVKVLCTTVGETAMPLSMSHWLHIDLPHRLGHTGLPVTTVTARERVALHAGDRVAVARADA